MMILAAAKPSLIDINFGLMFWTIVSFLIVLVVLKKFAFGPIQATLDERRNAIAWATGSLTAPCSTMTTSFSATG